jgi:hypothetical protein
LSLRTGERYLIAGAGETEYNGTFQITVTGANTFTYTVTGIPATPATGTITSRKAPLGWTRPFSAGTNSQVYRSADTNSNRFYLQVIDNAATAGGGREAQVYGAEEMSANLVVTTGRFPIAATMANGLAWFKSTTADATVRNWQIIGDSKTFYFFCPQVNANISPRFYGFGHFSTYKTGDAYNTFIFGGSTFATSQTDQYVAGLGMTRSSTSPVGNNTGWLARSFSQAGGPVQFNMYSTGFALTPGNQSSSLVDYPNPTDAGLYYTHTSIYEANGAANLRGRVPGMLQSLYAAYNFHNWYDQLTINSPSEKRLIAMPTSSNSGTGTGSNYYGLVFFDLTGPW